MDSNDFARRLRVLFIHGLEGSPQGTKAVFLAEHFQAHTPTMNTSDFLDSFRTQEEALQAFSPDVVVGSSFGGAIAVLLLARGLWRGPTLLLAPAAAKMGVTNELPADVPVIIAHGRGDDVIPLSDSQALARTGTASKVRLHEVDDDHRLQSLVDSGRLAALVREAHALGA